MSNSKSNTKDTEVENTEVDTNQNNISETDGSLDKAVEMYKAYMNSEPELDKDGHPLPPAYQEFLTQYTNDFARATMSKWWELGDKFWGMFARGF